MRKNQTKFAVRISVLAVNAALMALPSAYTYAADDPSLADLTLPTKTVEVGIIGVNHDSAKFGQHSGLDENGAYLNGAFDIRGGGYNDNSDATRWSVQGSDLGLDSRSLSGEYGQQGKFRLNFGYDELQSNRSDTYKTPYSGSSMMTLPAGWNFLRQGGSAALDATPNALPAAGSAASAATVTGATAGSLTDADLAAFRNVDLKTKRKSLGGGFSFQIDPQWSFSADAKREEKDGTQAIGQTNYGTSSGVVILPNPIRYTTDQVNLNLDYKGDNTFAQAAYYGSFFKDDLSSVTYQNAFHTTRATGTVFYPNYSIYATAPDNSFHQLNLTGGYNFSKTTKLVGDISYSRGTQDNAFPAQNTWATLGYNGTNPGTGTAPVVLGANPTSLDGLVVNKTAHLKLTTKPIKDLALAFSYKYDDRDNRTQVRLINYTFADRPTAGTTYNHPPSKTLNRFNVDANYALGGGKAVRGYYTYEKIDRDCAWSATNADGTCSETDTQKEDIWGLEFRKSMGDGVTGRIGYENAKRRSSTYGQPVGMTPGLQLYSLVDRDREKLRSSINWEATDKLSLTAGADLNDDRYPSMITDSAGTTYGQRESDGWALNLDAAYQLSDSAQISAYYTREESTLKQKGNNQRTDSPTQWWSAEHEDTVNTYGLAYKHKGLMSGKLDLTGDLSVSRSDSPMTLLGGSGILQTGTAAYSPLPDNYANSVNLKLSGKYSLDKQSAIRIDYIYSKLNMDDYSYMGLQVGANTLAARSGVMPTMEQVPEYTVQALGIAYLYSFK